MKTWNVTRWVLLIVLFILFGTVMLQSWGDPFPNPQNLNQLRDHIKWKINQKYSNGKFYFRSSAGDKKAILLVGKKKSILKEKYIKMVDNDAADDDNKCAGEYSFSKKRWIFNVKECPVSQEEPREVLADKLRKFILEILDDVPDVARVDFRDCATKTIPPFSPTIENLMVQKLEFMKRFSISPWDGIVPESESDYELHMVPEKDIYVRSSLKPHNLKKGAYELTPVNGSQSVNFLPWKSKQIIGMAVGPQSNIFFTAALSGCSVFVKGQANSPKVFHAGIDGALNEAAYKGESDILKEAAKEKNAPKFWRQLLEKLEDGSIKDPTFCEINRNNYTTPGGKPTDRLVKYIKKIKELHSYDGISIEYFAPWGCVFGLRDEDGWSLYLQENATIKYKDVALAKSETISVPIAVWKFFPGGGDKSNLIEKWKRIPDIIM